MAILTYDIGGTAIKSGLFEDGKLTVTDTFETQAESSLTQCGLPLFPQSGLVHAVRWIHSRESSPMPIKTCPVIQACRLYP